MPDASRTPDPAIELRRRLSPFKLPAADEDGVVTELIQHVEDRVADLTRAGVDEAEARRLALEDLSDEELRRGGWRRLPASGRLPTPAPGAPSAGLIDGMRRDLRYALRSLNRQRGFAITAVLALALGIGATTAIFAAVDAVLLRPMPFPHADRLFVPVSEHHARGITRANVTFADYEEWSRLTDVFAKVAIWSPGFADVTGGGDPERVRLARVSEQFFDLIDVRPLAGRTFVPADHAPGAPAVVVMTQQFWEQRFGAAPDVVGRTVVLGGAPREIVGILPARQVWPDSVSLFVPTVPALLPEDIRTRRDNMIFGGLVRLRDEVPADDGRARLAAIATRLEQDHPDSRRGWTNTLVPLREYIVNEDVTVALYVLLGAVVAVLLIACANVANLSLVRGSGRVREFAVRLALGASRRGLVQQLLVESALLCAVAAACGVTFALLFTRFVVAIAPAETPFLEDVGLNGRVLVFALVMTSVAAMLSGLVPAISSSALRPSTALRDGSAGAGVLRRTSRLRNLLVVAEIAAAVILVSGAALLMRSFERLSRVDPGVSVDRVVTGRIAIPAARYPTPDQRARFAANVAAELARRAEIESAALGSYVPAGAGGAGLGRVFLAEGRPEPPVGTDVGAQWITVTPEYFRTLGIRLLEGRAFEARDAADTTPVIIVSRRFAARMFPDEPAIGRRIRSWRDENRLREIVGVVDDVTYSGLADRERDAIYVPHAQDSGGSLLVIARSRSRDAAALGGTLQRAVQAVDTDVAVAEVRPLAAAASLSIAAQRYSTLLLTILAGVALALSALGIYGVINHVFTLRRREMGIRLALGATRTDLHRLVFRQGFALMAAGLLLGLAGAAATARWLRTLLFDTAPTDPTAWLGMVLVVVLSTALACLLPARRAAAADPTITLRAD
jgi:putative ABC transport system permease protein